MKHRKEVLWSLWVGFHHSKSRAKRSSLKKLVHQALNQDQEQSSTGPRNPSDFPQGESPVFRIYGFRVYRL